MEMLLMKKTTLVKALLAALALPSFSLAAYSGNPTSYNYIPKGTDGCYEISSAEDLYGFVTLVSEKSSASPFCARLTQNIVVNEDLASKLNEDGSLKKGESVYGWIHGIGYGSDDEAFVGTFDGNYHTISGLHYGYAGRNDMGLFAHTKDVVIKNLGVEDSYFNGKDNVGGLVGRADGTTTIINCYHVGTVKGTAAVGGLLGYVGSSANARVINSYHVGMVVGSSSAGALVGGADASARVNVENGYGMLENGSAKRLIGGGELWPEILFQQGTVAYSLHNWCEKDAGGVNCKEGGENGLVWNQYVGHEKYPNFTDVSSGIGDVKANLSFKTNGGIFEDGNTHDGLYYFGSNVTLPIPVRDGYAFAGWYKTEDFSDPSPLYTIFDAKRGTSLTYYARWILTPPKYENGCYAISNANELYAFADLESGVKPYNTLNPVGAEICGKLVNDIVVNENLASKLESDGSVQNGKAVRSWTPIKGFKGTFGGNNYSITGLYVKADAADDVGLFGSVNGAQISDVGIIDSYIKGKNHVGALVGNVGVSATKNVTTIDNSYSTSTVIGANSVGGLVGYAGGEASVVVKNCYNAGSVKGDDNVGGLVGQVDFYAYVTNCYNKGGVNGSRNVGGLVGLMYSDDAKKTGATGFVTNSYNAGQVVAQHGAHGLIGNKDYYAVGQITNSFALKGTASDLYDSRGTEPSIDATSGIKTADEFKNGSVGKLLHTWSANGENGLVWDQFVGSDEDSDPFPILAKSGSGSVRSKLVYVLNGGNFDGVEPRSTYALGISTPLPVPNRENYAFAGWYTNAEFTSMPASRVFEKQVGVLTLYAKWLTIPNYVNGCYEIGSAEDLFAFAVLVNGTFVPKDNSIPYGRDLCGKLTANIVVNENLLSDKLNEGDGLPKVGKTVYPWTPIGASGYSGTFIGNNKTISGLYFMDNETSGVGLFSETNGAVISNVGIVDSYFSGSAYVGGIVGDIAGPTTIMNCFHQGTVHASLAKVGAAGGLVGNVRNEKAVTIKNSYHVGAVSAVDAALAGGLVGRVYPAGVGGIANVYNSFALKPDGSDIKLIGTGSAVEGSTLAFHTEEEFNDGTVARLLHNWRKNGDNGLVWSQYVGNGEGYDLLPIFTDKESGVGEVKTDMELVVGEGGTYEGMPITTYPVGVESSLPIPTREGFDFGGWYENEDFSGSSVAKIMPETRGAKKFYARWGKMLHLASDGYYEIGSEADLYAFAALVNGDFEPVDDSPRGPSIWGKLTNDITVNLNVLNADGSLSDVASGDDVWTPIGSSEKPYAGKFDGNSHSISGLYINDKDAENIGLFGVTTHAEISNVGIKNSYMLGKSAGGLVGKIEGLTSIKNAYNTGVVIGAKYAGGLVGLAKGTVSIKNSYTTGSVANDNDNPISNAAAAGLVAVDSGSVAIVNCYTTGAINGRFYAAGLVADVAGDVSIANSYSVSKTYTTVGGSGTAVGGLVGEIRGEGEVNIAHSFILNNDVMVAKDKSVGVTITCGEAEESTCKQSMDHFKDGLVTYYLRNWKSGSDNGLVWGQYTGHDDLPVLSSTGEGKFQTDLTFVAKGGSVTNQKVIINLGVDNVLETPTFEGKIFGGWYSDENFSRDRFLDELHFNNSMPVTLYAKWQGNNPEFVNGCYEISNAEQLYSFVALVNGSFIPTDESPYGPSICGKLMRNIVVNESLASKLESDGSVKTGETVRDWTPIMDYKGTFYGNNKTISGLYVKDETAEKVGLFGSTISANISNVGVVDFYFKGGKYVGGLVGYVDLNETVDHPRQLVNSTFVTSSFTRGTVVASGDNASAGGLLGYANGPATVKNSYTDGKEIASGTDSFHGTLIGSIEWLSAEFGAVYVKNFYSKESYPIGHGNTANPTSDDDVYGTVTGKEISDGTLAVKLHDWCEKNAENNCIADGQSWVQHIGHDNYPILTDGEGGLKYDLKYELGYTDAIATTYTYGVGVDASNMLAPSREGYVFAGWFGNPQHTTSEIKSIANDEKDAKTLYAKWDYASYKITYKLNWGSFDDADDVPGTYTYSYGIGKATLPTPKLEGLAFGGWYDNQFFVGSVVKSIASSETGAKTFYARWGAEVKYVLNTPKGEDVDNSKNLDFYTVVSSKYHEDLAEPTRANTDYVFEGWYENKEFSGDKVTRYAADGAANKTFYAKWGTKIEYVLNANGDYVDNTANPATYLEGVGVKEFSEPSRAGYTFKGWYDSADKKFGEISTTATGKKTLYAKWEANIYYVLNGADAKFPSSKFIPETYEEGKGVSLVDPVREGYTFDGWYTSAGTAVKSITAADRGAKTIYAKWSASTYEIAYVTNGGRYPEETPFSYTYGTETELLDASRVGYDFDGWYDNVGLEGDKVTSIAATATGAKKFYAKWNASTYNITYDLNGGSAAEGAPSAYTYGVGVTLVDPEDRNGYDFFGWYTFTGEKVSVIANDATGDVKVYAIWNPASYDIEYVLDGGTEAANAPSKYTYGVGATLKEPTRDGYSFGGWYENAEFSGSKVISIATTATGNKKFYAKWFNYGSIEIASDRSKATIHGNSLLTANVPTPVAVNAVEFDRSFVPSPAGNKIANTIVLPFATDDGTTANASFFAFTGMDFEDGFYTAKFATEVEANKLEANVPYAVILNTDETKLEINVGAPVSIMTGSVKSPKVGDWEFSGSYANRFWDDGCTAQECVYGFAAADASDDSYKAGDFVKGGSNVSVKPMRAVLRRVAESYAPRYAPSFLGQNNAAEDMPDVIAVLFGDKNGEVMFIGQMNTRTGEITIEKADHWFDLKGRRLNAKPTVKGSYYNNGKRVIIK